MAFAVQNDDCENTGKMRRFPDSAAASLVNHKLTRRLKPLVPGVIGNVRRLQEEGKVMAGAQDLEDPIGEALQRRVQTIQGASREAAPRADSKRQAADRVPGQGVAQECDAIAAEIENTGQTVINLADTISAETEALAELLRKHGAAISARIEEFMTMSDRVRDKMRSAHDDVLTTSGTEPSLPAK
jgi:hypothetical protein